MDVANEEQVNAGIARSIANFGALNVLVSNAGIQIVDPIVDFEFAKWKKLLAIHLDGAFLTTRAALRQMYRRSCGPHPQAESNIYSCLRTGPFRTRATAGPTC